LAGAHLSAAVEMVVVVAVGVGEGLGCCDGEKGFGMFGIGIFSKMLPGGCQSRQKKQGGHVVGHLWGRRGWERRLGLLVGVLS